MGAQQSEQQAGGAQHNCCPQHALPPVRLDLPAHVDNVFTGHSRPTLEITREIVRKLYVRLMATIERTKLGGPYGSRYAKAIGGAFGEQIKAPPLTGAVSSPRHGAALPVRNSSRYPDEAPKSIMVE